MIINLAKQNYKDKEFIMFKGHINLTLHARKPNIKDRKYINFD